MDSRKIGNSIANKILTSMLTQSEYTVAVYDNKGCTVYKRDKEPQFIPYPEMKDYREENK